MEKIVVQNLSKSYGDNKIFENVSFEIKKGQTVCIMGGSGIGKTTLLRLMMGLEAGDMGSVTGVGKISAVFQEDRLIDKMSAADNVRLVTDERKLSRYEKKQRKAFIENELAKLLPIESIHKPISELSGGMKRRVAIARAYMADSDTVFLDEPFTGLDKDNKNIVCEYMSANKNNRTVFVVTHDESDLNALEADICLLTSEGTVATILRNCE